MRRIEGCHPIPWFQSSSLNWVAGRFGVQFSWFWGPYFLNIIISIQLLVHGDLSSCIVWMILGGETIEKWISTQVITFVPRDCSMLSFRRLLLFIQWTTCPRPHLIWPQGKSWNHCHFLVSSALLHFLISFMLGQWFFVWIGRMLGTPCSSLGHYVFNLSPLFVIAPLSSLKYFLHVSLLF